MNEKVTTILWIEFLDHELTILEKLPVGTYTKAIVVEEGCGPRAVLVKLNNVSQIDDCGVEIDREETKG